MSELGDGLYLIRRGKLAGPGKHYAVLSVRIISEGQAEVLDYGKDGFRYQSIEEWLHDKEGEIVSRCPDEEIPSALERIKQATDEDRGYNLFKNNCEHVANWIALGQRESAQVKGAADVAVIAGTTALVIGGATALILALKKK